jgi:pimeloyl-ACP methyl ester carboxylesterase
MGALYRSEGDESALRTWCTDRLRAWETPHRTSELQTCLGRTHLTTVGEGPDVCVYLPGTNFNAATSMRLLTLLGGHCRVVCADLPGQPGLSTATRPRDEVAADEWLAQIVDSCARPGGSIVLMGHSRDAALALAADRRSPTASSC